MALSTYADLKAAISSWVDREDADFAARVPDFIALCEQRLNFGGADGAGLRVAEMEKKALIAVVDGSALLPDDFLEPRMFRSTTHPFGSLDFQTPAQAANGAAYYAGSGSVATVELLYYAKIPALSDANPTNWLLTKAPGIYLYGSLLESAPFESDDARMQSWLALYSSAVAGLKQSDAGARWGLGRARVRGSTP